MGNSHAKHKNNKLDLGNVSSDTKNNIFSPRPSNLRLNRKISDTNLTSSNSSSNNSSPLNASQSLNASQPLNTSLILNSNLKLSNLHLTKQSSNDSVNSKDSAKKQMSSSARKVKAKDSSDNLNRKISNKSSSETLSDNNPATPRKRLFQSFNIRNISSANLPKLNLSSSSPHLDDLTNIKANFYEMTLEEQAEFSDIVSISIYNQMKLIQTYDEFVNISSMFISSILNFKFSEIENLNLTTLGNFARLILSLKNVKLNNSNKSHQHDINTLYDELLSKYQKIVSQYKKFKLGED